MTWMQKTLHKIRSLKEKSSPSSDSDLPQCLEETTLYYGNELGGFFV